MLANARTVVLGAHQQHRVGAGANRLLGADRREVGGVADAGPPGEDVPLLPFEDRGVDVGLARQHPRLPERRQRRGNAVGGEGGRWMLFEHTVRLVGGRGEVYTNSRNGIPADKSE